MGQEVEWVISLEENPLRCVVLVWRAGIVLGEIVEGLFLCRSEYVGGRHFDSLAILLLHGYCVEL